MREAAISRTTGETEVRLHLKLEGTGRYEVQSGVGFLDHMLALFARHGGFDLELTATGDTQVDDHHTVEDIGICLGLAFEKALGDLRGVNRYGHILLPMDEALIVAAVDLSGRGMLVCDLEIPSEKVGTFDTELVKEFLTALARKANLTLHIRQLAGENSHHIIEGVFKALARALRMAVAISGGESEIPSTKGVL